MLSVLSAAMCARFLMEWDTSCADWERRIVSGMPLVTTPALFPDVAEYALNIFKELRIVDMIGRPKIGEVTRDWVFDLARPFFGSLDDIENQRYIKEFFLCISKKNTKSTIAAGVMLTVLITNPRESAEFLILAPTKEAANNCFNPCRDMIRADDELNYMFHVQPHLRTITNRISKAVLKVVAADSDTVSGTKATGVLIDELWAFGKKARARSMLTEATGGLMSRPEGFTIYLTTQSDEPPAGIFKEKLQYARQVRDGIIKDPEFLPVLYEFPKNMIESGAFKKPENFKITNPNLGASVDKSFLERKIRVAEEGGQESIQEVYAKHLNVEIGLRLHSDRWKGADFWEQSTDDQITLDYIISVSDCVVVGIDGGGLDDLLGFAVLGRHAETGYWLAWCRAWAHKIALERRKSEISKIEDFANDGDLVVVKNIGEDIDELAGIVETIEKSELLYKIGVDQNGIGAVLDELENAGIEQDKMLGISQGWKLGGAIKTAERRLSSGQLKHANQALMNWCVGNAKIEPRANGILITKSASGYAKIDPLIALLNAVQIMSTNPPAMTEKYQLMVM